MEITDTEAAILRTAHDVLVSLSNESAKEHKKFASAFDDDEITFDQYLESGESFLHTNVDCDSAIYAINSVLARLSERQG